MKRVIGAVAEVVTAPLIAAAGLSDCWAGWLLGCPTVGLLGCWAVRLLARRLGAVGFRLLGDHCRLSLAFISTATGQNALEFIKLVKQVLETDRIETILADQYPGINSKEFKQFLEENNIKLIYTAVNAPFSNGLNERFNQTFVNKMRCKMNEGREKKAWTTIARECVKKYNSTEHSVTGFAPKYLLDGTDISILPKEFKKLTNSDKWIKDRETALKNSIKSHEYNKTVFDKNRKQYEFKKGEFVFVENGNKLNRRKMDELRIGPFKVEERTSNSIYKINIGKKNQETALYHVTKLIPATQEEAT
uniref:Integrase catalytic domain-containing protein n=1 Tax=Trichogramma kaykai TaxID=54128 RepID=A0ABD2X789_9HYME